MPGNCGPKWENLGVGGRKGLATVAQNGKILGWEVEIACRLWPRMGKSRGRR